MSNNNSVTILTPKSNKKGKSKSKVHSKRKSRKNSEKHIEERDDEVPWPPPDDSTIAIYNQLLSSKFNFTSLDSANFLSSKRLGSDVENSNGMTDKQLNNINGVQKNLGKMYGSNNGLSILGRQPIQSSSNALNYPRCSAMPVAPISSEDVCTLFQNPCQISCGNRGLQLPAIGVFWDIENCSIPKGKSALAAVQRIRDRFFAGHVEAEFITVCDIRKESPGIIQELNDAQVSVIHVSGNSKNAADDKLRQSMRRFADMYSGHYACTSSPFPATLILISGDINFSSDLSDLRHRKRLYVILLHNRHAPEALLLCAHEQYDFHPFLGNLPCRPIYRENFNPQQGSDVPLKGGLHAMDVLVCDLPYSNSKTQAAIKNRLRKLSDNCGGKVITVQGQFALVRFPNKEAALRATKRMNGEDVLGSKIRVIYSSQMEFRSTEPGLSENSTTPQNTRTRELSVGPTSKQGENQVSAWKPTWKNRGDNFISPPSRLITTRSCATPVQSPQQMPPHPISFHLSTINTVSTSPPETNEGSPNKQSTKNAKIVPIHSSTPLNNTAHPHPPTQANKSEVTSNLESSDDNMRLLSQENNGLATVVPRLFSAPFSPLDSSSNSNIPSNLNGLTNVQASTSILLGTPNPSFQLGNSPSSTMRGKPLDPDQFDLHVTNIDPNLGDWKIIRHTLMTAFAEHVNVKGVWVYISQDNAVSAVIRTSNKEEGHYAVAQLHRKKFGSKRIFISFDQGGSVDSEALKKEVASLLQDVPGSSLPLFKFREMFEKRYRRSVSSSDLYRLRGVVAISDNCPSTGGYNLGRTISLSNDWKAKDKNVSLYCLMHPPKKVSSKSRTGWAEKEAEVLLPNVMIDLKQLSTCVNSLLTSHQGTLPLISFLDCYEAEFEKIEIVETGSGVPLEHLLACIRGVEITFADNGMKSIQFIDKTQVDTAILTQPLATQLAQFGREMVDLLKIFPRCSLAFSKLIPAYHHHFGRQCRVADYGHFNLQSLLQTIPHVIQIMGAAQNRILTLSHKAQMKRFATDLLRVLKAHGGVKKQIRVSEFSNAFIQVFPNRQFLPEDYGLCYFSDLITELVDNSTLVALLKDEEGNEMLAVPKREQTAQEMHRTRIFASEVVQLFRHSIRYEMPFSKFIPAYHHHFGKQCRVSDYGFTKLAELFEAIGDTVICVPPAGPLSDYATDDKMIRLLPQEQVKVVGEQLRKLIQTHTDSGKRVKLSELDELFIDEHGFQLRPEMCGAEDIDDLMCNKLSSFLKVENGFVTSVGQNEIRCFVQHKDTRNNSPRCHSADKYRPYNHHLKMDSGRWSESPKRNRAKPPSPLYLPSPGFTPRGGPDIVTFDRSDVVTFDRQLSPPVYDMWMREPLSPGSPPVSPPVVWTYHPIVYPPNTPPANTANIMLPAFSFNGAWSPAMAPTCFERMPSHGNGAAIGSDYTFSDHQQQTRLIHGMERLGMEGRNDA